MRNRSWLTAALLAPLPALGLLVGAGQASAEPHRALVFVFTDSRDPAVVARLCDQQRAEWGEPGARCVVGRADEEWTPVDDDSFRSRLREN